MISLSNVYVVLGASCFRAYVYVTKHFVYLSCLSWSDRSQVLVSFFPHYASVLSPSSSVNQAFYLFWVPSVSNVLSVSLKL